MEKAVPESRPAPAAVEAESLQAAAAEEVVTTTSCPVPSVAVPVSMLQL